MEGMRMTDQEFADTVFEIATRAACEFSPFVLHNKDGDCVEVFFSSNSYYGKWINHDLTFTLTKRRTWWWDVRSVTSPGC